MIQKPEGGIQIFTVWFDISQNLLIKILTF